MVMRILILFTIFMCSWNVNAQIRDKQIRGLSPYTQFVIMGQDTVDASAYQGLGKWYAPTDTAYLTDGADSLIIISLDGDTTFVELVVGGSDTYANIEIDDVDVSTNAPTIDFQSTDFAVSESPTDEFNITVQAERIQDVAGAMVTGNTETGITVTYEDSDGTIDFVATDASATNEAWTVDADDAETELITTQTVKFEGAGIISTDYVPATDKVIITGTEVDGSTTNEAWTIDADDTDTEVITNQTVRFEGLNDIVTNYIPLTNTLEIEYTGTGGADGNGIFTAANDGATVGTAVFNVLVDQKLIFDGLGADPDNILAIDSDNGRVGMGTNSPNYGLHSLNDAGAAFESSSAGINQVLKIEGTADGGGANNIESTLLFSYTDADYLGGAEQTAINLSAFKESDASQWTSFKITAVENTDADAIVIEKQAAFSSNTTESHIAMNGGMAYTQTFDYSTSADLDLDRSYYNLNVTGGTVTDTINLPEVASTLDNWDSGLTSAQAQVGQTYVITNFRSATSLVIAAFETAGNGTDDLIDTQTQPADGAGAAGSVSAITIGANTSVVVRCVRLASGVGYWYSY